MLTALAMLKIYTYLNNGFHRNIIHLRMQMIDTNRNILTPLDASLTHKKYSQLP